MSNEKHHLPPPANWNSWLDYAVATLYTRRLFLDRLAGREWRHLKRDIQRSDMEEAAEAELAELRGEVKRWQAKNKLALQLADNQAQQAERLRVELEIHRDKARGEYWAWQGDGSDYPESLVCPVLISAADLRTILQQAAEESD